MILQQITDAELDRRANADLDNGGVRDCRVATGNYREGNRIVYKTRLIGGSTASRAKAKSLLPYINFPE
jgi:hypothetical protein